MHKRRTQLIEVRKTWNIPFPKQAFHLGKWADMDKLKHNYFNELTHSSGQIVFRCSQTDIDRWLIWLKQYVHSPIQEPINSSSNTLYTTIDKFASGYSGVKVSTILVAFSHSSSQIHTFPYFNSAASNCKRNFSEEA